MRTVIYISTIIFSIIMNATFGEGGKTSLIVFIVGFLFLILFAVMDIAELFLKIRSNHED